MSTTRDFDQMLAERLGDRASFRVAGQEFTLRAKLPYSRWQKLLASMQQDPSEVDVHQVNLKFFDTVLIKADRARFRELLENDDDDTDDDEGVIDMAQLDAITDWAIGHFTGKLQSSSSGSSPGVNGTGPSPKVISLGARTTAS